MLLCLVRYFDAFVRARKINVAYACSERCMSWRETQSDLETSIPSRDTRKRRERRTLYVFPSVARINDFYATYDSQFRA